MKVSNGSPAIHESSWRILAVFQEEQQSGRIHPNSEEYKIQTVRSSKTLTNLLDGVLVLKDFNIVEEAGGVGKVVVKTFPVMVKNGSLEIRLYWAGKGTVAIPVKGVYGPLISTIAIDRVKNGTSSRSHSRIWIGIGVGLAVIFLLLIGCAILWYKGLLTSKSRLERELKKKNSNTTRFSLRQLSAATDNFSEANKLAKKSKQGSVEFLNEVGVISALQHPNMVKLHGFCVEGKQLLLVYEFVENNNLARTLLKTQISLDWPTRQKICLGVARSVAYIQEESRLKILHKDIKASNILLDKDLNAKIADFGLAKLFHEDESHITTNLAGTPGYWDPQYAMKGQLSDKSDVYSFGVLALEDVASSSGY
ncbi:putative leucine-rich repeat receptor-like serine/threonine-protein kinase [Raphanus sativus]|nr:putative leucine-rich repeat receptor-like serine/threonine-protein kinase [Raphanus sativus]